MACSKITPCLPRAATYVGGTSAAVSDHHRSSEQIEMSTTDKDTAK
jgi:hypothetical protein